MFDNKVGHLVLILMFIVFGVYSKDVDVYDSGGTLMPEQAAYDVHYYNLDIFVNPSDSSLGGFVDVVASIVQPIDFFVLDLDPILAIKKITQINDSKTEHPKDYFRVKGKVWVELNRTLQAGESVHIRVYYGGKPRISKRPPWEGGFTWAKTKDGSPWIATACQGTGADIWWPTKDHISDEPDSMGIHIRIPKPLICASNGKLLSVEEHDDNTQTYHWFVSTPINNYNVALNIAPYKVIEDTYKSTSGDMFPVAFWVLPEDYEKGQEFFPEILDHLKFFEKNFGPYPFRADKYGVAQTPHLGMEHQTIIAFGSNFDNAAMTGKDWGFDALHHHELSHEWWGNLVTCRDWKDMWIHEGFGAYTQAMYMEELEGLAGYHRYIKGMRSFGDEYPVAPLESTTSTEIWKAPIYTKAASMLHTLRYLIGDEAFKESLRRMAYPEPEMEKITDGSHTRFATTNDFISIAEKVSGQQLDWFFDVYLHQPLLPELSAEIENNKMTLRWHTPGNIPFNMPVDIKTADKIERIDVTTIGAVVLLTDGRVPVIDPENWVLFNPAGMKAGEKAIGNGQLDEAGESYKKVLVVDPQNKTALNILKHIDFIENHPEKMDFSYFKKYTGNYTSMRRATQIIREDNKLLLVTQGQTIRIYPTAENEFWALKLDAKVEFVSNENDLVEELLLSMGDFIRKSVRVEN